jgi:hypothetical protein
MSEPNSGGGEPDPDSANQDRANQDNRDNANQDNANQDSANQDNRDDPTVSLTKSGRDEVQDQDQISEPVFNDPTAPVWADPTAPMPSDPHVPSEPPVPPGAFTPQSGQETAGSPYGQPPAGAPSSPPFNNPYAQQPPVEQPYGQQPPVEPYGQPQQPYGVQQPYGQAQSGQQYGAYGQQQYATGPPTQTNGSAIALTIVSVLSLCNFFTVASLVLGIIALTRTSTDPESSRRLTKIGWIVFAVSWGLVILGVVASIIVSLTTAGSGGAPNPSF